MNWNQISGLFLPLLGFGTKPSLFYVNNTVCEWAAQLIRVVKTYQRFHTVNWGLGSLSWESMHFRHLASEDYDLFDPLNHVWEGVFCCFFFKKKEMSCCGSAFKETLTLLFKHTWQERGMGSLCRSQGNRGGEEGEVFLFSFRSHNTNMCPSPSTLLLCICFVCCRQQRPF